MTNSPNRPINLPVIAHDTLLRFGFLTESPAPALLQLETITEPNFGSLKMLDLTSWLWSSIDNDDSRDLDQIEYLVSEPDGARLYVGIADVASFVSRDSPLDLAAQHNTTSVYTGVHTIPLFPEKLSTNLTSLLEGQKRLALVIEMKFTSDGSVQNSTVYRAIVQNKAQLTYHAVAAWLDGTPPDASDVTQRITQKIKASGELQNQLRAQHTLAEKLLAHRIQAGALTFDTQETQVQTTANGQLELHKVVPSSATRLIEDFMIAANQASVTFLEAKGFPSIRRIVRTPKNWPRIVELAAKLGTPLSQTPDAKALEAFLKVQQEKDPDHYPDLSLSVIKLLGRGEYAVAGPGSGSEHFALAVQGNAHTTAPNRRYPDVLIQRLLLAASAGTPAAYSVNELATLAQQCTQKEDDANKAERSIHKSIAAALLRPRIGETFDGFITGVSDKGVWVRIAHPPVEGRVQGETSALKIGDAVRVKLISTDPWQGYIDFAI